MRFYRYLIYRLYTWRLRAKDNAPIMTVVMTMCVVHYFQAIILYVVLTRFVIRTYWQIPVNEVYIYLISFGFIIIYYLLIYNKKRWEKYIEEFKDETPQQRKIGTIHLRLFTIGSVVLFFICMPLLYWNYESS